MFDRMFGAIRKYNNRSRTIAELSRLSDRELNDIGIARANIGDIARRSAISG